jgi:hypothetical protein
MNDMSKQDQKQAEFARRATDTSVNLGRQGAHAGAEAVRHAGEGANEAVRRSVQATIESQNQIMLDYVQIFEEAGRKVAEMARGTSEDMRRFFVLPQVTEGGLRDVQQSVTGLVEGVLQTNLHTAQALFRLANPTAVVELQQRFIRNYMDVLMQGTATLVRAVHRTTGAALHPLEEQVQQRQQEERYRNAAE